MSKTKHKSAATTEQWIDFFYPRDRITMQLTRERRGFLDTLRDIRRQPLRSLGCGKRSCICFECLSAPFENK